MKKEEELQITGVAELNCQELTEVNGGTVPPIIGDLGTGPTFPSPKDIF